MYRRTFLRTAAASIPLAALAGCAGFDPPDPKPPATVRWGMPLADAANTASNGLSNYPATDFSTAWAAGGSGSTDAASPFVAIDEDEVIAAYPTVGVARHDPGSGETAAVVRTDDPDTDLSGRITAPPLYADGASTGLVVATDAPGVYGIDLGRGAVDWSLGDTELVEAAESYFDNRTARPFSQVWTSGTVTPDGDAVLVSDEGDMVKLAPDTGEVTGGFLAESAFDPTGPPVASGENIVVGHGERVLGLGPDTIDNGADSDAVWFTKTQRTYRDVPGIYHRGIYVCATTDGTLVGFDATPDNRYRTDVVRQELGAQLTETDGESRLLWETEVGTVTGHGTRAGNVVVYPYRDGPGGLVAVATGTGAVAWDRPVENGVAVPPVSSQGLVYVVDGGGRLHVVDALTGETVRVETAGVADSQFALGPGGLVASGLGGVGFGDRVTVAEGGDSAATGTSALRGDQDAATLEHLHENLLSVADRMNRKTAYDVVPQPLDDDDARNVLDEVGRQVRAGYEDGSVPYDVARGTFERMTWALRGSDLLLSATRARRPSEGVFRTDADPVELVGYNTGESLSDAPTADPTSYTPQTFESSVADPENSLAAHTVYGLIRAGWNALMLIPISKVANVAQSVFRGGIVTGILRNVPVFGRTLLNILRRFRSFLRGARSSLDDARQALRDDDVLGPILRFSANRLRLDEEGAVTGGLVDVLDNGAKVLTGTGIREVIETVLERLAAEVADATIAQNVERPAAPVGSGERPPSERRGNPRTDGDGLVVESIERTAGPRSGGTRFARSSRWATDRATALDTEVFYNFRGYTTYETIDAVAQEELIEGLTRSDGLPGNRQGAADAAAARYRQVLGETVGFTDGRQLLEWGEFYPDGIADTLRDMFDIMENPLLVKERARLELGLLATRVLWSYIDQVTDIPGGIGQSIDGAIHLMNQAQVANGLAVEDTLYGVGVEESL